LIRQIKGATDELLRLPDLQAVVVRPHDRVAHGTAQEEQMVEAIADCVVLSLFAVMVVFWICAICDAVLREWRKKR
jgi:hypothetical protein